MTWIVIYETVGGKLISETDDPNWVNPNPAVLSSKDLGVRPPDGWIWDKVLLNFVAPPAPRVVDKVSWVNRWTLTELRLLFGFQRSNATATQKQNVDGFIGYLTMLGDKVDLDDTKFVTGMDYLETTNPVILAAGRSAQLRA